MSPDQISWHPDGTATLVGSLPHGDRQAALELVFDQTPALPVWPQLSAYPLEQMLSQFIEGVPGLVRQDESILFRTEDPNFEQQLVEFYEEYLAVSGGDIPVEQSRFQLGEESGRTFFAFLERLSRQQPPSTGVKGQIVGPFTLLSWLKDEHDRLALYDSRLCDVVVKTLALKAQWQAEQLLRFASPVLIFIDEPGLAGFGSSTFISVSAAQVGTMLEEVAGHIHQGAALAGIHVCANTDWSLFFNSSLDLINFDAYTYFDRFALYRHELVPFIERGGVVAWGIVPTMNEDNIRNETAESLVRRWHRQIDQLLGSDLSLQTLFGHSLITPSCGCGSLSEALAERVVHLTREVSDTLRRELAVGR
jgi:methionine synthase II (cobalamin-independent)